MLTSVIFGVVFGLGTGFAIGPVSGFARSHFELTEQDSGTLTFGVLLLLAALLVTLLSGGANAFWLVLGGLIGAFGLRIYAFAMAYVAQLSDKTDGAADAADEISTDDATKDT